MYGKGNSGPSTEQWETGDRVMFCIRGRDFGAKGRVFTGPRDPDASEAGYVWVKWDDGQAGYIDPNSLDIG